MLAATVTLHDITNVEAFVHATLDDSRIRFGQEEREELVLEGFAILYDLAASYKPHIEGYAQPGRFSGYAARYLPRRLGEAWHKLHPDHVYRTKPEGGREWIFLRPAISLDAALARAGVDGNADSVERRIVNRAAWAPPQAA
jgi:hypothetical protein